MQLANFDVDAFRRDYWQKRPLLIRNPWTTWANPVEPDELAGLACEPEVEARLIVQKKGGWKVRHGPFDEARFAKMGKAPWTLLVQAVDHHSAAVAALVEPFRFVPNWRIDDVMVSYASDGGGVGPHFDQYDVFLIQGLGRRRWQVGAMCDAATTLLPNDDLKLLAEFEATDEWVLEPGDMLYVPPGIAHNGVAVGDDCMTYSVGFRAPSRSELIAHWCDHILEQLQDDDRYTDPDLGAQANPGEITADAVARLQAMVAEKVLDRDAFARWFGAYNSEPKNPDIDWRPEEPVSDEELQANIAAGRPLVRNPASRFSYVEQAGGVLLFVDGESFDCTDTADLARHLCASDRINLDPALAGPAAALLRTLLDMGSVSFEPA